MKTPVRPSLRPLAALLCALALPAISHAQTSSTWSGSTGGNWSVASNWSNSTIPNGTDDVAIFSTATSASTVNLDENVTLGNLTMGANWTIANAGGTLTLATSTGTPILAGGNGSVIAATIAGTQGFTANYSVNSHFTLSGNNTYGGLTTLNGGYLAISSNNGLGATGSGNGTLLNIGTSGTYLQLHFTSGVTSGEDITAAVSFGGTNTQNTTFIYGDSGTETLTGNLTLARSNSSTGSNDYFGIQAGGILNLNGTISGSLSNGTTTGTQASGATAAQNQLLLRATTANTTAINISGVISDGTIGTGGLAVVTNTNNLGIIRLKAANTYSGPTIHQAGILFVDNTSGSGTGTGSVTVFSGATLGGNGTIAPVGNTSGTVTATISNGSSVTAIASGVEFQSGSILSPGDSSSTSAQTLTFNMSGTASSVLFDSGATLALTVNASGTLNNISFVGLSSVGQVVFNSNQITSITGTLAAGTYTIATFDLASGYSGNLTLSTALTNAGDSLQYTSNSIELVVGSAIPEPATTALIFGATTLGVIALVRRRRKA